jgi:hypothetical protein
MRLQVTAVVLVLVVCALSVPSVRSTVWDAVPGFESNDCRKVACADEGGSRSTNAPEMKLNN